jgi:hypothetical protein
LFHLISWIFNFDEPFPRDLDKISKIISFIIQKKFHLKKEVPWSFQSLTMKKEDTNAQSARGKK